MLTEQNTKTVKAQTSKCLRDRVWLFGQNGSLCLRNIVSQQ
jgi:hypothetical protein